MERCILFLVHTFVKWIYRIAAPQCPIQTFCEYFAFHWKWLVCVDRLNEEMPAGHSNRYYIWERYMCIRWKHITGIYVTRYSTWLGLWPKTACTACTTCTDNTKMQAQLRTRTAKSTTTRKYKFQWVKCLFIQHFVMRRLQTLIRKYLELVFFDHSGSVCLHQVTQRNEFERYEATSDIVFHVFVVSYLFGLFVVFSFFFFSCLLVSFPLPLLLPAVIPLLTTRILLINRT